ncbi:MAG: hypothetical protein BWK74_05085, partial [Desulfobacteraceae bacterium A6]
MASLIIKNKMLIKNCPAFIDFSTSSAFNTVKIDHTCLCFISETNIRGKENLSLCVSINTCNL